MSPKQTDDVSFDTRVLAKATVWLADYVFGGQIMVLVRVGVRAILETHVKVSGTDWTWSWVRDEDPIDLKNLIGERGVARLAQAIDRMVQRAKAGKGAREWY